MAKAYENLHQDPVFKTAYQPEATEPSMFTRGEGVLHPRWVNWFMNKFALSHQMASNIGNALYDHLEREPRRYIDPNAPEPQAMLKDVALVSMAFVLHYKHKHNVSFTEAYTVGYDLVSLQAGTPGFEYTTGELHEELVPMPLKA
jgi:hypothetical protein